MNNNNTYHFYTRRGFEVRESRDGETIRIEVKVNRESFTKVFEGRGVNQAIKALAEFVLRQHQIMPAFCEGAACKRCMAVIP